MIFEIIGSRVLGPYLGTSIFVWTGLIGIVLGSLSLGYWIGGKIADKNPKLQKLSRIIFLAGMLILITAFTKEWILVFIQSNVKSIKLGSVVAAISLFAPASVALGIVSPYAAKLRIHDLQNSGSAVGNLYAISALGSILGTFAAGFFLIPLLGTTNILYALSICLIAVAFILSLRKNLFMKMSGLLAIAALSFVQPKAAFIDLDTQYNRVSIYTLEDEELGEKVKYMRINNQGSSAMFVESDELVLKYCRFYKLAEHFNPGFKNALMIGGAAYSFPKDYIKSYPEATIDVVEIDPELTELAKKHFRLKEHPNLRIFHEDGRTFLNRTDEKYDLYYGDAFKSIYSIPFHLTTTEAVEKISNRLNENGVAMVNILASISGEKSKFLQAEWATFKIHFPQVYLFPIDFPDDPNRFQNIVLVALKTDETPFFKSMNPEFDELLQHRWKGEFEDNDLILTDDFAPVEFLVQQAI